MTLDPTASTPPTLSLSRELNADPQQVFEAWTDPLLLAKWWGPKDFTNPICEFEPRPGGGIRIDMRSPDGIVYPMTGAVEEVEAPGRLVFTSAALNDTGRAMFKVRTAVKIEEKGERSLLTLQAWVIEKSPAAAPHIAGMEEGWKQSLDRLEVVREAA